METVGIVVGVIVVIVVVGLMNTARSGEFDRPDGSRPPWVWIIMVLGGLLFGAVQCDKWKRGHEQNMRTHGR